MKYMDAGFRSVLEQFAVFTLSPHLRELLADFPLTEEDTCLLVYGYMDHAEGMTAEVLAAGENGTGQYLFREDSVPEDRWVIRMDAVGEEDFTPIAEEDGALREAFQEKLKALDAYAVSEDIAKTRQMTFLDGVRDPYYIDDVLVQLQMKNAVPEECWVRLEGLGDHYFLGNLLNEPRQNFGFHKGDQLAFGLEDGPDGTIRCTAQVPPVSVEKEDLQDGSLLQDALKVFNLDPNEANAFAALKLLRDSTVWMPAPPRLLRNEGELYLPVFSSAEAAGEYGANFSLQPVPFLDAAALAAKSRQQPAGIVADPFTEAFVIPKELFPLLPQLPGEMEK